jgi:hypothetical protein
MNWSMSATVWRAMSSIAASAVRERPGSRSWRCRAAPARTAITLSAWPAESCRSRAIRAGGLLRHRELPLARGLLFGEDGALAEFGHLLAAQPGAFAREPRGDVGEAGVDQVAACEAEGRHARTEICDEQDHHDAGAARRPRRRVVAAAGEQVQRRRRSQRRPDHDAGRGQQDARRNGQREDTQR